ncbi:MAG: hypothetical protein V4642_07255 [Bacteroidota bacterium]
MKLRTLFSIFASGIFAFSAVASFAQDDDLSDPLNPKAAPPRIYIGPVAGYNRAIHTGKFASIPNSVNNSPVPCPIFDGGSKNGFYVGGTMEYLLGNPKDAVSSIIGKLVYNYLPGSFAITGLPYNVVDPNGRPVSTTVQHVDEVNYQTIDLELLYKLNLFGSSFGVVAGPTMGMSLGKATHLQQFELVQPTNATFEVDPEAEAKHLKYSDDKRTITISDGELPNAETLRAAIKAGVQYEILNLFGSRRFILAPHVFYNFGITKLTSAENWRVNAFQTGVDLRYGF